MVWWQGVLVILGSILAGSIVGLLSAYVILRIQKRPWPFSKARRGMTVAQARIELANKARDAEPKPGGAITGFLSTHVIPQIQKIPSAFSRGDRGVTVPIRGVATKVPGTEIDTTEQANPVIETKEQTELVGRARDTDAESIKKQQKPIEGEGQVDSRVSGILKEVETNLGIAVTPWTGKLLPFRTEVWDASGGEIDSLPANYQYELAEAYADMHLANRIVWLSTDMDRRSEDLDGNYIKICVQIAERLNKVSPSLRGLGT